MTRRESRPKARLHNDEKTFDNTSVVQAIADGNENADSPEPRYSREDFNEAVFELEESKASLQRVVDTVPALAWCTRRNGAVEFVNQQWEHYTGLRLADAHDLGWNVIIHPEDLPPLKYWEAPDEAGQSRRWELRLRRSDGVFRPFLLRREPLRDDSGALVRWYWTAADIEDLKHNKSLRDAEKRALEMIADGASLKDVLDHLCSVIDSQVSPSVTEVLTVDPDGTRLWHGGGPLVPREWISSVTPEPVALETGLFGAVAFLKKRVIVTDFATGPGWSVQYRDLAIKNGIRSAWAEPILTKDNEALGAFAIYSSESRVPTGKDLALIAGAARIALIAIERHRSQEALRSALDEIRNSETNLRRVIDTIPALAWCARPDGSIDFLNKRWHDYTGLSPEETQGFGYQAAFHPEDRTQSADKCRELFNSEGAGESEVRLRRYDGVYRWFLIRVEPFHDETGKIVRWYGTSTDIENLKQIEEKLREEERELRRITDAIPQTIIVQDPDGVPIYANRATLDYTGLTIEDVLKPGFRERIFHPEDIERLREERKTALGRGVPFELEQRALGTDGQYRWFLIRYNPFRDEQGRLVRWYATGTDIDERKRNEERTRSENIALREEFDHSLMFEEIVGSSRSLRKVLNAVDKVASTDSTVLILGETGTGKELIARAIHKRSQRSTRAFIRVNCAAIPQALIASELFGHEKGAFTGALERRIGRFETADGGTLFLDEVGDLPAETQIALLRVLQEREFERVGSARPIRVDVRVLAATNRNLAADVEDGSFRQDLYYRLNVFPINLPPLRERTDDIPLLVEYLVERYAKKAGKKITNIDRSTLELFKTYDWPGNVRELQNVIERAIILCETATLSVDNTWFRRESKPQEGPPIPFTAALALTEREVIERALLESAGRIGGPKGAAMKLGVPRQTLESKIKILGINKFLYKRP